MRIGWLAVGFVAAAASAAVAQPPRITPTCDRACLEGYVDRYLDAMLANEVNPKLFARDVKFTENGVRLPLGNEGLWFGMSGRGKYEFYVPDTETQQVAFIGTVIENGRNRGANDGQGNLVALAVRLEIVSGLIDRERGIVFSFAFFDHEQINWTWQLAELFKIENGQIRRVEAIFHRAPYGLPSGWSSYEQAMSETIQSVR